MPEKPGRISPPRNKGAPAPFQAQGLAWQSPCGESYYFFSAAVFAAAFSTFSAWRLAGPLQLGAPCPVSD